MSESWDTTIKLFGRTITPLFVENRDRSSFSVSACAGDGGHGKETSSSSSSSCSSSLGPADRVKEPADNRNKEHNVNYGSRDPTVSSDINEEPKPTSETSSLKILMNNGHQQSETTATTTTASPSPGKTTLHKPNKILPCPRCNSKDTKFCYYNNYNVNQPRHFCRNCQRYWTAGGSMRNVPVGAGRRKCKSLASSNHCQQFNPLNINGSATILSFGSSNSMVSEAVHDKFHMPLEKKLLTFNDHSGDISVTADSASRENKNYQGFLPPQATFTIPPPPWPYQWNPAIPNANLYRLPLNWGCAVPFLSPPPNNSPSLGKRSRDRNWITTEREGRDSERNILVSESLETDEPGEAAKSSAGSALGIKSEKTDKLILFSGFETKGNNRNLMSETSLALQANPAALGRSLNFRESM